MFLKIVPSVLLLPASSRILALWLVTVGQAGPSVSDNPVVRFSSYPLPCVDPNANSVKGFHVSPYPVGFSPLPSSDKSRLSGLT